MEPMWEQLRRIVKPNGAICLFSQLPFSAILAASNIKELRYEWIWEKNAATGALNANRAPMKSHENILVFYRRLPTYNPQKTPGKPYKKREKEGKWGTNYDNKHSPCCRDTYGSADGSRYPRDVIRFAPVACNTEQRFHPTQKPIALLQYLIRTYTHPGETVLDFTMGSGSTGVAAINEGREFVGIELDENYYSIAEVRCREAQAQAQAE